MGLVQIIMISWQCENSYLEDPILMYACQGKDPNPASSPPTILRLAVCFAIDTPQPAKNTGSLLVCGADLVPGSLPGNFQFIPFQDILILPANSEREIKQRDLKGAKDKDKTVFILDPLAQR